MSNDDTRKNLKNVEFIGERSLPAPLSLRVQDHKGEEFREQYNYYYNRIYPLLKEGKLDFHRLAEKTGHKERRVRETLLFRLTTGEVMQLFGKKDGFCYICGCRLFSVNTKEPMCLNCLQTLDTAIQELHLADLHESPAAFSRSTRTDKDKQEPAELADDAVSFEFETVVTEGPALEPEAELPEWIPRAQFESLLREVQAYRAIYGALPAESQPSVDHKNVLEFPVPADDEPDTPPALPEVPDMMQADAFLDILDASDGEVHLDQATMQDIAEIVGNAPIRHYGFLRMKTTRS